MNVEVVRSFKDCEAGVMRSVGEQFEATAERVGQINSAGFGQLVKEVPKPKKKPRKEEPQEQ